MNSIIKLLSFGQSAWLDNLSRSLIQTGRLNDLIARGLSGLTSNPTIFDNAINNSADYDVSILKLSKTSKTVFEIYDDLTVKDVQDAADIFLPLYEKSGFLDGYVSLEINPQFAFKKEETIKEALRLKKKVNRANAMFKVPATNEGVEAIEELVSKGVNINATLIFSLKQYIDSANAYISGLKRALKDNKDISRIHSIASVFVSRMDTVVDSLLSEHKQNSQRVFRGKAAVANCAVIYKKFLEIFYYPDFKYLSSAGGNIQRPLWASTSTKNPAYSDIKYVTELIAKDTVNTMPENTFTAFLDHGVVKEALTISEPETDVIFSELSALGIDIDMVSQKLLNDGVIAFEKSFQSLLLCIQNKSKAVYNK